MTPEIQAQIARLTKAQEALSVEEEALWRLIEPLLTNASACNEMIQHLPECSVRFKVWMHQKAMAEI